MQDAKEDRYRHALLLQRGGNLGKYTRATDKPKWDAINSLSEFKKYSNKTWCYLLNYDYICIPSTTNVKNVIDGQGELSETELERQLYNQQDTTTYGTVGGNGLPTSV